MFKRIAVNLNCDPLIGSNQSTLTAFSYQVNNVVLVKPSPSKPPSTASKIRTKLTDFITAIKKAVFKVTISPVVWVGEKLGKNYTLTDFAFPAWLAIVFSIRF